MTTPLLNEADTALDWQKANQKIVDDKSRADIKDSVSAPASSLGYQPYYDQTNIIRENSANATANQVANDASQKAREAQLQAQEMQRMQAAALSQSQNDINSYSSGNTYAGDSGGGWGSGGAQGVANVLRAAGFPESAIPTMMAIAKAESGWNPSAFNGSNSDGSSDQGLFQINTIHKGNSWYPTNLNDPLQSAKAAYALWSGAKGSYRDWTVYNSGKYKDFLQAAPPIQSYVANTGSSTGLAFASTTGGSSMRQAIVNSAMSALGTPYVFGGESLSSGIDCSGLVHQVYNSVGMNIGDNTADSYSKMLGTRTSITNLQPGDLVAWQGGYRGPNYVGHIAIYVGDGQIIEAYDTGTNVRRVRLLGRTDNAFGIHVSMAGD